MSQETENNCNEKWNSSVMETAANSVIAGLLLIRVTSQFTPLLCTLHEKYIMWMKWQQGSIRLSVTELCVQNYFLPNKGNIFVMIILYLERKTLGLTPVQVR